MYVCIYIYIYTWISLSIYMCIYIYIYVYSYICIYTCIGIYMISKRKCWGSSPGQAAETFPSFPQTGTAALHEKSHIQ